MYQRGTSGQETWRACASGSETSENGASERSESAGSERNVNGSGCAKLRGSGRESGNGRRGSVGASAPAGSRSALVWLRYVTYKAYI